MFTPTTRDSFEIKSWMYPDFNGIIWGAPVIGTEPPPLGDDELTEMHHQLVSQGEIVTHNDPAEQAGNGNPSIGPDECGEGSDQTPV
jgi:hypothetical protein